jgi:hypothetical protein
MIGGPHIQALRDALRTEHEEWIAEVQQWADEAATKATLSASAAARTTSRS